MIAIAAIATFAATLAVVQMPKQPAQEQPATGRVMLVLRGVADSENPRGQLDDEAALEYARRTGFQGEVLDVAGNPGPDSTQVKMAVDRIRSDERVTAIYGFSGGGYNAKLVWRALTASERERIRTVVVVGAPGVTEADFGARSDVLIQSDPPEGHLAGPKALLDAIGPERGRKRSR